MPRLRDNLAVKKMICQKSKGYFYELIVDFIFVLNQMTINQYSKDFKQQQHLCLLQCYYLLYCGNM